MVDLTKNQMATLREMESYSPRAYWFRQATCKTLVALGLAEVVGLRKRPPHVITEAGRSLLKAARMEDCGGR